MKISQSLDEMNEGWMYEWCEYYGVLTGYWLLNHLVLRFALFEYRQYHLQVQADIEHFLGSSIVFEQFWQEENNLKNTQKYH